MLHACICIPQGLLPSCLHEAIVCLALNRLSHVSSIACTCARPGFAIVKLATDRKTQEQYAVKIMTLPPMGVQPGDNESTRYRHNPTQ